MRYNEQLTRRKFLKKSAVASAITAAGVSSGLWLGGCGKRPQGKMPNIILISMDTTRRDHCSTYGYERDTTPSLRAFAEKGTSFDLAYAPTSTTGPTHATVFTSLYPIGHQVLKNGLELSGEHETLAEILSANGYQTASIVSSFVLHSKFGYAQGFASCDDKFQLGEATVRVNSWEGHQLGGAAFDRRGDYTTGRAINWLENHRDSARPFFLFVHYFDPHDPYRPPEPFATAFALAGPFPPRTQKAVNLYDAEIAFTDHEIGKLLESVKQLGLDGETLVVLFSDHGEGLMQHRHMAHGVNIYEEAVRVPLLFRWPGYIERDRLLSNPVELTDLMPTILDLTGITPTVRSFHGRSLAESLCGRSRLDMERRIYTYRRRYKEGIVWQTRVKGEKFGVRAGPWKYIEGKEEKTKELYNLEDDPLELKNLRGTLSEKVAEFSSHLKEWKKAHSMASSVSSEISQEDVLRLKSLGYVE
jgi:arylsulfatase A-like enzyme